MKGKGERGEAQLSNYIALVVIVALAWAAWNVAPLYLDHYDFQDKINEIARTLRFRARNDEVIMDMLMKEVRERRLGEWIGRENFTVNTTDTSRRIILTYERSTKVLPGWEKTFEFTIQADQPLV
jgi:hypothetical protein